MLVPFTLLFYSCINAVDMYACIRVQCDRKGETEREEREEDASWGMMAKLLRAVSQLGWLARCVSVRFVRRLTAWSRRDKARPTLPPGFCSGLISYPPRRATPRRGIPEVYFAIVARTPRVPTRPIYVYPIRDTAYDLVPVRSRGVCAIPILPREFHKTGKTPRYPRHGIY